MLLYSFEIFTGALLLFVFSLLLFSKNRSAFSNKYLLLTIAATGLKKLIDGLYYANELLFLERFYMDLQVFKFCIYPAAYLYLYYLIHDEETNFKSDVKHFVLPIFLGIINFDFGPIYLYNNITLLQLSLLGLLLFYVFCSSYYFYRYFSKSKSLVGHLSSFRFSWIQFTYIVIVLAILRLFVLLLNYSYFELAATVYSGQWLMSIGIVAMCLRFMLSPELYRGFQYFSNHDIKSNTTPIIYSEMWTTKLVKPITNNQDVILYNKMAHRIPNYVNKIEVSTNSEKLFRNPKISIADLATELRIPKSHLSIIFKYHCNLSYVEYKNKMRIYDALEELNADYLSQNTMEALATQSGFSSYNAFFMAFNKVTGCSPKVYTNEHLD